MMADFLAAAPEFAKGQPLMRVGTPEDMAGTVVFLCSRAGSYIVGLDRTRDLVVPDWCRANLGSCLIEPTFPFIF